MAEPNREEIRAWLRGALKKLEETPTGLARRAGVAQSTLTRFLNSDEAPMLGLRTITKIAHAADINPIGMPSSEVQTPRPTGGFAEPDGVPYRATGTQTPLTRAIDALIGDRPATDPWTLHTRALEGIGYLPGDILIVSLNMTPNAGQVVCAQEYRWSEGKADTIFRIYEPPYIVAASSEAAFRKPLLVDNDRVVIKGVVIASIRAAMIVG